MMIKMIRGKGQRGWKTTEDDERENICCSKVREGRGFVFESEGSEQIFYFSVFNDLKGWK